MAPTYAVPGLFILDIAFLEDVRALVAVKSIDHSFEFILTFFFGRCSPHMTKILPFEMIYFSKFPFVSQKVTTGRRF